jgi:hypothetical protein
MSETTRILTDRESNEILTMRLHQGIRVDAFLQILRVPGGWVYTTTTTGIPTSVFVPHNGFEYTTENY